MDSVVNDVKLTTLTFDGFISNISFKKETIIHTISLLDGFNIIKIGCNYGVIECDNYNELIKNKKNYNSKKKKKYNTHKKQGSGNYFNSQITFTYLDKKNETDEHIYQVKLFTNGRIQIPGINEDPIYDDSIVNRIINNILNFIQKEKSLIFNKNKDLILTPNKPILRNYKSIVYDKSDMFIDLRMVKSIFLNCKNNRNTSIIIEKVIFNPEKGAARLLIKFRTPCINSDSRILDKFIELTKLYYYKKMGKPKLKKLLIKSPEDKMHKIVNEIILKWIDNNKAYKGPKIDYTTVSIFKSSKININSAVSKEEAIEINNIVSKILIKELDSITYYDN